MGQWARLPSAGGARHLHIQLPKLVQFQATECSLDHNASAEAHHDQSAQGCIFQACTPQSWPWRALSDTCPFTCLLVVPLHNANVNCHKMALLLPWNWS